MALVKQIGEVLFQIARFVAICGVVAVVILCAFAFYTSGEYQAAALTKLSQKIDNLEAQIKSATEKVEVGYSQKNEPKTEETSPVEFKLNNVSEIDPYLAPLVESENIQEFSSKVAEVDRWVFPKDQEVTAVKVIADYLNKLRGKIYERVEELDRKALAAQKTQEALALYSEGNVLMSLFPVPQDPLDVEKLNAFVKKRQQVYAKIQQLQLMRYNLWALDQIQNGFVAYNQNHSTVKALFDDDDIVRGTSACLDPITTDLLNVAAMEQYMALLRLSNDSISQDHKNSLARRLTGAPKRPLEDF